MKIEGIIELLKNNNKCNFLAMAITPLHAVGIDAVISYLRKKEIELNGYVLITAHPSTGRVLNKNSFSSNMSGIKFIEFEYEFEKDITELKKIKLKINSLKYYLVNAECQNDFFVIWTEIFTNLIYIVETARPSSKLQFIQIDDGFACYMNRFKSRLGYYRYEGKHNICSTIKLYTKALIYDRYTYWAEKILKRNGQFVEATIFKKNNNKHNRLEKNELIAQYYVDAFLARAEGAVINDIFYNSILINSQCLVEVGALDGDVDKMIYQKLSDVLDKIDSKVVLKPHPREVDLKKYDNLGWNVVCDYKLTQESLLASLEILPRCIISIDSSTLLNAYGLYNIPAISLARIVLRENITPAFRDELEEYISLYEGVVLFPNTYNELEKILLNL